MIKQGEKIPDGVMLGELTNEGMLTHCVTDLCAGKKVVLFAVPGAFTPTCSESHLPGFVALLEEFKAKGADIIACVSVNDAFVMKAWGDSQQAAGIMMLADGDASFTQALGLQMDTAGFGGMRSQRYAMVLEDGVVTELNVEAPKMFEVSKAEVVLDLL